MLSGDGSDVIAGATDGEGALRLSWELRPDVVLLDVQLPDGDGLQFARELALGRAAPAVVLVSSRSRSDHLGLVERSGVAGVIDRAELSGDRLREALGSVPGRPPAGAGIAGTRREPAARAGRSSVPTMPQMHSSTARTATIV